MTITINNYNNDLDALGYYLRKVLFNVSDLTEDEQILVAMVSLLITEEIPLATSFAQVVFVDGKKGVISKFGWLFKPLYDEIKKHTFSYYEDHSEFFDPNGISAVRIGDRWGLADLSGDNICEVKYDGIITSCYTNGRAGFKFFNDLGVAIVKLNNKFGLISRNGEELGEIEYDKIDNSINSCFKNLIEVQIGEKRGLINNKGKKIIPPIYTSIIYGFECLLTIDNNIIQVINDNNEVLVSLKGNKSDKIYHISRQYYSNHNQNGIFILLKNNKVKYIVNTRNLRITEIDDGELIEPIEEYRPAFTKLKINNFINLFDFEKMKFIFVNCDDIIVYKKERMIAIKKDKWAVFNPINNLMITEYIYDAVQFFDDSRERDFCAVKIENRWGIIDKNGKEICPVMYEEIEEVIIDHFIVKFNGKKGVVKINGEQIGQIKYDKVYLKFKKDECSNKMIVGVEIKGLFKEEFNGVRLWMDRNGNEYYGKWCGTKLPFITKEELPQPITKEELPCQNKIKTFLKIFTKS